MILAILLLLMAPQQQQQQQIQDQLQRQQQQLEQIHQDLQKLRDSGAGQAQSICSVEVRRVGGPDQRRVAANVAAVVPLNLFAIIGKPVETCLPAEIRVAASYLDASENLVCSGVVENVAIQTSLIQNINLDIHPWDFREFVRWKNEPPERNSGPKRLVCLNNESTAEASSEELGRISSVRVRVTVFPKTGGLSTTEIQLNLR
jgi:type II secretory pathway pseudopilin PulG